MSNIIRLLPNFVANQIAAGEVIQRPASVVKEILENAIDANSNEITLITKEAGKLLIQVVDNGIGMNAEDAKMSFAKHATSKINNAADLFNIKTMGFRGEALSAIAAISKVTMLTCCNTSNLGTKIIVESSKIKLHTSVSIAKGTSISVKNLFCNLPARRSFIKSNALENKHIIDEFQRVALSRPDIRFVLYQDDHKICHLPSAKLNRRIVDIFGENYKKQLIPCQEDTNAVRIKGYVGKPIFAKKTRGDQFFFVNNRFIKSPYLHNCVKNIYDSLLPKDTFPFYVIFIDIDPKYVDINVHPTKTEVAFADEGMVYSILASSIKKSLALHHVIPAIDFDRNVNFSLFNTIKTDNNIASISDREYIACRQAQDYSSFLSNISIKNTSENVSQPEMYSSTTQHEDKAKSSTEYEKKTISQFHGRYLFLQVKSGILIMDQSFAHERILYEKYLNVLKLKKSTIQKLLWPVKVMLNPSDVELIKEHKDALNYLGFDLKKIDKDSIIISGCPSEILSFSMQDFIEGFLEQFKFNVSRFSFSKSENLIRSLAKRSCIKIGKKLTSDEISLLADQLFGCENPNYTPEGNVIFVILSLDYIDLLFNKT